MDWQTTFSLPNEHILKRNTLLKTLPTLAKEWKVAFDFKPTNYDYQGPAQVLQMTIGGMVGNIGDRTPALWMHKTRGVYIVTALNGKAAVGSTSRRSLLSINGQKLRSAKSSRGTSTCSRWSSRGKPCGQWRTLNRKSFPTSKCLPQVIGTLPKQDP